MADVDKLAACASRRSRSFLTQSDQGMRIHTHIENAAADDRVQAHPAGLFKERRAFRTRIQPQLIYLLPRDVIEYRNPDFGRDVHSDPVEMRSGNVAQSPERGNARDRRRSGMNREYLIALALIRANSPVAELLSVFAGADNGHSLLRHKKTQSGSCDWAHAWD